MKKVILGAVLALVAGSAFAGALLDPVTDTDVIVQSTAASFDHGILVPLVFLAFLGVVFLH